MQAKINGVQLGYDDYGQGPAVLFIHDYPLPRQMWQQQVEPLVAAGFRVILPDLRGFGESELGSDPVDIQSYSGDIIGLLDYLGIGRAAVCGLSLGGYILFDLMERYPQRIAGACLAASRPVADDIHERAKRGEIKNALDNGQLESVKNELFCMLQGGQADAFPLELARDVHNWIQAITAETLQKVLQALGRRKDYTFLLRNLKIPTLLIGAELDPIIHHKHTDIMAHHLPNCYRMVKLRAGHLVNLENAQEFNRYLIDFLQNLAPQIRALEVAALSSAV